MTDRSQCAVTNGEVDLAWYAERDGVWRKLGLSAPARRALINDGRFTVKDLKKVSAEHLATLHGMGPKAIRMLQDAGIITN